MTATTTDRIIKKSFTSEAAATRFAMEIRNPELGRHAQAVKTKSGWRVRFVQPSDDNYEPITKSKNMWRTSDIRIWKDSVGAFYAEHRYQGYLYDCCWFEDRNEARREAVLALRAKQS